MLIHKAEVEVIKTYHSIKELDIAEIETLIENHKHNKFSSDDEADPNDNRVCIKKGVLTWTNNTVILAFAPEVTKVNPMLKDYIMQIAYGLLKQT